MGNTKNEKTSKFFLNSALHRPFSLHFLFLLERKGVEVAESKVNEVDRQSRVIKSSSLEGVFGSQT
jgi:hypothetical protein